MKSIYFQVDFELSWNIIFIKSTKQLETEEETRVWKNIDRFEYIKKKTQSSRGE